MNCLVIIGAIFAFFVLWLFILPTLMGTLENTKIGNIIDGILDRLGQTTWNLIVKPILTVAGFIIWCAPIGSFISYLIGQDTVYGAKIGAIVGIVLGLVLAINSIINHWES